MTIPVGIDWRVCKSGKTLSAMCGSVALGGNNNHIQAEITAVNAIPTLLQNGQPVTLGPVVVALPPFEQNDITQTYNPFVHWLLPTPALQSDVFTVSYEANIFTTTVNSVAGSIAAGTDVAVVNSTGLLESPGNYSTGPNLLPTMLAGVNIGQAQTSYQGDYYFWGKNKVKAGLPWQLGSGTSTLVVDENYYPQIWTPGGTIQSILFYGNEAPAQWQGTGHLQYDDDYYGGGLNGATQPQEVWVTDAGVGAGSPGITWSVGTPVVTGGVVTIPFTWALVAPNTSPNNGLSLTLQMKSNPDGKQHAWNPWVFIPGNTVDRSNPYAVDDNIVRQFTNLAGVPGTLRAMSELSGAAASNIQDVNGLLNPSLYSWLAAYKFNSILPTGAPFSQTFSGTCSTGSDVVTGIADTSFLAVGDTIVGNGIPGSPIGQAMTTISSITPNTSITLSNRPTVPGVQTLSVNPTPSGTGTWVTARPWNTAITPRVYSSSSWAIDGTDSFGPYKDVTLGPLGVDDDGVMIGGNFPDLSTGVLEFVSPRAHGLRTGDLIGLVNNGAPVVWSVSGAQQLNDFLVGTIWVTGPTTVACRIATGDSGGSANQQLEGTYTINVGWSRTGPESWLPYEFFFGLCATWVETIAYINLPFSASDPLYAHLGTLFGTIAPGNSANIETGNEPWNEGGAGLAQNQYCQAVGKMMAYFPSGTQLYEHYTPDGGTAFYVTNSEPLTDWWEVQALLSAHAHFVFKQAYIAAGGTGTIKCCYSGQYGGVDTTTIAFIIAQQLPQDYFIQAPYQDLWFSQLNLAMMPIANGGQEWPVDAGLDVLRFRTFYGTELQNVWKGVTADLAGTTMKIVGYEGGFQSFWSGLPNNTLVSLDAAFHPAARDLIWCHLAGLQQGHPNVANSGMVIYNYFQYCVDALLPLWGLTEAPAMPITTASIAANQFETPQGGLPGVPNGNHYFQTRGAPMLAGLIDWIGGSVVVVPPGPPPFIPGQLRRPLLCPEGPPNAF